MRTPAFLASVLCLAAPAVGADKFDWPQWQGPDRDAVSQETGLLQEWPEGGPPLAWRVEGLGGGDSAPAVADGRIFGMSARDGKEIVWALSEADGEEIWITTLGDAVEQRVPQSQEGPACTPTVDGDRLYVLGMGGRLACLSVDGGDVLWQRSLVDDFGGVAPTWSYRESPLVDGDKVVCTPGGPEALLAALDKLTGETIWKTSPPSASDQAAGEASPRSAPDGRESRGDAGRPPQAETADRRGDDRNSAPQIAGTKDSALFQSERWGMTGFQKEIPDGSYLVKLYFAETYAGITGSGERVFSFDVEGKEFEDFDIWEKAGGRDKAYIESVPVEIMDGRLDVTFTRQVENPAIKAIEIIRRGDDAENVAPIRINAGRTTPFTDSEDRVWLADQGFVGGQGNPGTMNFGGASPAGAPAGQRRGGRGGFGGFGGGRSGAAYSSPIAIDFEGERQYVQLTSDALVGVAASDGKLLWRYAAPANRMGINISTPIYRDGILFASSAYGNGGGAAKLIEEPGGGVKAEEVYFAREMQNHHGGMIVTDGALYGANGGNEGGFLTCLDFATGDVLWRDRDAPKGSLVMADGRLYLRAEGGELLLIEPSREELIVKGRFDQPDRTSLPAWAHPVVANGKLYVRDQGLLLCYNVKAE
ncbi:PQQ-binding-like beta-propeller repeat protein [Alienimonas chondri]|uniref:Outer membrane protein assembly factor BamB n=1 Tax=Alienimonas chondri TaxID=2681879 RepID=A0ABX1VA78_9PLAN|nr:PQQ-binding-like beta-propeller repeat protein [Alienimonas chondri]NNJ24999.1 Outer membrane protein assembly factor BamB [Alienimonas chondri]